MLPGLAAPIAAMFGASATPSPGPSSDAAGPLGTGAGIVVALALIGLLLWSRSRTGR